MPISPSSSTPPPPHLRLHTSATGTISTSPAAEPPPALGVGSSDLRLRPMRRSDLPQSVRLHAEHLPKGLFPALGQTFLRRWHATFIDSDHARAAVIVDTARHDQVAAFVLVALNPAGHSREAVTRHRTTLASAGVLGLLRRPRLAWYFLRTRAWHYLTRMVCHRRPADPHPPTMTMTMTTGSGDRPAVVHAVVTATPHRGQGLARRMLLWARGCAVEEGVCELALVTDADPTPGNDQHPVGPTVLAQPHHDQGAAGLYHRLGWTQVAQRSRDGRTLLEFRIRAAGPRRLTPTTPTAGTTGKRTT